MTFQTKTELRNNGLKQCQKCGEIKKIDDFHFNYKKNNKYRRSDCIQCKKNANREYYKRNKERLKAKKLANK